MFLERIAVSSNRQRQIFWDCLESPLLFYLPYPIELPAATPPGDIFLRHVPIRDVFGISVALGSGSILAITSHQWGEQGLSLYNELGANTVWTHCPLSTDEEILTVWVVRHKSLNMGTRALVASLYEIKRRALRLIRSR